MRNIFPFFKNYFYSCNDDIDSSSLIELSNQLPSSTLKKTIIKLYIKVLAKTNLISILPKVKQKDATELINYLDIKNTNYLIFSQNIFLRNRKYCFTARDNSTNFIKLVWGNETNTIKNIFQAKKYMKNFEDCIFFFPTKFSEIDNRLILEYDILPSDSELVKIRPVSLFNYFLKTNKTYGLINSVFLDSVFKTKWWLTFDSIKGLDVFKSYLNKELLKKNSFRLSLSHGDLGSENIFYHKNKYIIIDWEKFSLDAPIITDFLGIILGNNSRHIISKKNEMKNKNSLISFYESHIGNNFSYSDFLLGLVFYLGTDFNLAFFLVNNFHSDLN